MRFRTALILLLAQTLGCGSDPPTAASAAGALAEEIAFADAKLIIEHNATAQDTGFQAFVDGEPWSVLAITGPDGRHLLDVQPRGELKSLGLTELFFETDEPENAEVPIPELLALLPEGNYRFEGRSVDGPKMTGTATLSHLIPAGPHITAPEEGATVDPTATVVRWQAVTESITGAPVDIVGYEVIVEKDVDAHPPGFSNAVLDVHVSDSTFSLTVPREFLESGTAYKLEVLALEAGGNQTITSSVFETM